MTRGARTCRQLDDGLNSRSAPRHSHKPLTYTERARRWRLSLASLLFLTLLLSDRLRSCAEATLTSAKEQHPSDQRLPQISPITDGDLVFIGDSTQPVWRLESCHPDSLSKHCYTFAAPEGVCGELSEWNLSDLYLSFCDTYSLLDLFYGFRGAGLNCSLEATADAAGCRRCVQAFQRRDRRAEREYREFEVLSQKYEQEPYSVRSCMQECKTVYKPWLCSQYFQTTQMHCSRKIPCRQFCLEVQQRCPFILPDNDDLIHGGNPSFICTEFLENQQPEEEIECCDVRWDVPSGNSSKGTLKRTHHSCEHRTSTASSGGTRLCHSRLKLCLLVLALLHTVATLTASENSTGISLPNFSLMDENSKTNEE
ncbi:transmembrane protein FAM155A [Denticeps clupeoides]|uniref:Uncharacterized protein n=1 Tax=Denticeps clupeoides TaxID=299321 RepID=A0AAY4BLL0_9TELE|nr:transmembrane protein FAM155A [Denticeps clupeoides]